MRKPWQYGFVVAFVFAAFTEETAGTGTMTTATKKSSKRSSCFHWCETEQRVSGNAFLPPAATTTIGVRWGESSPSSSSSMPLSPEERNRFSLPDFQNLMINSDDESSCSEIDAWRLLLPCRMGVSALILPTPKQLTTIDRIHPDGRPRFTLPFNNDGGDDDQKEQEATRLSGPSYMTAIQDDVPNCGLLPGSTYLSEMRIPLIGRQSFRLRITGSNTAQLDIQGRILRLQDDNVVFSIDDKSGDISFVLSRATDLILCRFRTRLGRVAYDMNRDEASLEVKPPLPTPICLRFKRI